MLVDSDNAVSKNESAHAFLQRKYKKLKLQTVTDEQCHLMVRIMESWFIADIDALKGFYGQGFNSGAIPKNRNVEAIEKEQVENSLKAAIAKTNKKEYHKIKHGAKLLEFINPQKVHEAAPHCEKSFDSISKKIRE